MELTKIEKIIRGVSDRKWWGYTSLKLYKIHLFHPEILLVRFRGTFFIGLGLVEKV